jgi:cell division protein FtsL
MKKHRWSLSTLGVFLITLWIFLCFYVFLYSKLIAIGYKMETAKKRYDELTMINKNYKAEILTSSSQENLLKRAKESGMELISPSNWCYIDVNTCSSKRMNINDTAEAGIR